MSTLNTGAPVEAASSCFDFSIGREQAGFTEKDEKENPGRRIPLVDFPVRICDRRNARIQFPGYPQSPGDGLAVTGDPIGPFKQPCSLAQATPSAPFSVCSLDDLDPCLGFCVLANFR